VANVSTKGILEFFQLHRFMKLLPISESILLFAFSLPVSTLMAQQRANIPKVQMMIRIAEIEVDSTFLTEYTAILQEESEASVRLEEGVISIFPMFEKVDPTKIKILEIYASRAAYESHLKTPHFLKYKTETLSMVKSLKLIELDAIDPESMSLLFEKFEN
jgi:quinol monooxygenase YgiN